MSSQSPPAPHTNSSDGLGERTQQNKQRPRLESARRTAEFAARYVGQLWDLQVSGRFKSHIVDIARLVDGTLESRGRSKSRLIETAKAIRALFRLNEDLGFAVKPTLFTPDCWRKTTRNELMEKTQCTEYQLKMSLRELESAGFLERHHPQIGPHQRALWIRLHIRGIHALLDQVSAKEPGQGRTVIVAKGRPIERGESGAA